MLAKIRAFFTEELTPDENRQFTEDQLHLAAAALMIEVASADADFDVAELVTLREVLQRQFGLSAQRVEQLAQMAQEEKDDATSLYQFTQLINQHADPAQKFNVLHGMWQIAYANGDIDKYEEHLIRKVAELIYVPHSDFIRAKLMARDARD